MKLFSKLRSNQDILIFQISNWISTLAWYAYFAKQQNGTFPTIAAAELSVAFFGVIATTVSLRRHDIYSSRQVEIQILLARLASTGIVCIAWIFNSVSLVTLLAFSCFALTPAHLPMKIGFRASLLWPLILRIPIAGCLIWLAPDWKIKSIDVSGLLYFGPGILYGIISYFHYFPRLETTAGKPTSKDRLTHQPSIWSLASQILVTAGANQVQAGVVASILKESAAWGVAERVARSSFSFIFPYIVRSGIMQKIRPVQMGAAWVAMVAIVFVLHTLGTPAVQIAIPVSLDVFVTLFAGRSAALDAAFLFCLGLFHFQ